MVNDYTSAAERRAEIDLMWDVAFGDGQPRRPLSMPFATLLGGLLGALIGAGLAVLLANSTWFGATGPVAYRLESVVPAPPGEDSEWFLLAVPHNGHTEGSPRVSVLDHFRSNDADMLEALSNAGEVGTEAYDEMVTQVLCGHDRHCSAPIGHERPLFWTGGVRGPSGGLILTLATIDRYVAGPLAGPLRVAGTGTINPDGTVGPIGAAALKYEAAAAAGADIMFVPMENLSEIVRQPDGPLVIPVRSVDEALDYLCRLTDGAACLWVR